MNAQQYLVLNTACELAEDSQQPITLDELQAATGLERKPFIGTITVLGRPQDESGFFAFRVRGAWLARTDESVYPTVEGWMSWLAKERGMSGATLWARARELGGDDLVS